MIIGMIPMALGLGERRASRTRRWAAGPSASAASFFATVATLFFVPTVFSMILRTAVASTRFFPRRLPNE